MNEDDALDDDEDEEVGECWACGGAYDGGFFVDAAVDHKEQGLLPDGFSMFDAAAADQWRDADGVLMGDLLYQSDSYLFGYATSCEGCGESPDIDAAIDAWRTTEVDPAKVTTQAAELRRLAAQLGMEPDDLGSLASLWARRPMS